MSPDAARAFRLLGLHTGPDISTPATAALVDQSVPKTRLLLDTLANVHLLEETGSDRYRLHDLLRDYAAERAAADEPEDASKQSLGRIHAWYLHSMDSAARILNSQADHVPLDPPPRGCEPTRFASHREALAWCDAERSNLVAAVYHAAQRGEHAIAWKLAIALTGYFTLRWHLAEWITTHRVGLDAARQLGDRYGEGRIINGLGGAYRALQEFDEALEYSRQAIAIFQQTGHRKSEGMARRNVGAICGDLHRFDQALDNLAQARAICREINDQNGECSTLIHFGLTYQRLHQHEEAIDYFNQALELCRKTGARQKEREVMRNIGSTLRILGRHTEATKYFRQALQISRDIGERWGEADSLQGLGQVLHDLGELDQAHQVWRDALTIFDDINAVADARIRNHLQTVRDGAEPTLEPEVLPHL